MKILLIGGARPNFMKLAPIVRELKRRHVTYGDVDRCEDGGDCPIQSYCLIHTGQHYDRKMSGIFFRDLELPEPIYNLDAGGGTHAEQTAAIMVRFEQVCVKEKPELVVVVGDVNSTLACSIVAKKLNVQLAHVEAGLRSGDVSMPEEINRLVTDSISDLFFVTEPSGVENLLREGKSRAAIHFVGQVMIDNLLFELKKVEVANKADWLTTKIKSEIRDYGVVTLHRASNVDNPSQLRSIMAALSKISESLPLVFPAHPRTSAVMNRDGIRLPKSIVMTDPLGYAEFLNLWKDARVVITDSGGLQEETTALGVPCVTARANTERPITVTAGTNVLAGPTAAGIIDRVAEVLDRSTIGRGSTPRPPLWDGRAAVRIVDVLCRIAADQ